MKNKRLNLSAVKVKSFVTEMESESGETIQGGNNWFKTTLNIYTLEMFGCPGDGGVGSNDSCNSCDSCVMCTG